MNVPPELIQFLGSLVAIFALAGLAWWLKLGPEIRLESELHACSAANEVADAFEPVTVVLDKKGAGAILNDVNGQVMVLKPHGNKFAGRILNAKATARLDGPDLVVDTGEKRFGQVRLAVEDRDSWVEAIDRLGSRDNA